MTHPIEALARAICAAHHEWHQSKSESDKDEYTARVVIQTLLSLGWQAPQEEYICQCELSGELYCLKKTDACELCEGGEPITPGNVKKALDFQNKRIEELLKFRDAIEQMRERCAKLCERYGSTPAFRLVDEIRALPTTEVKP
jgi:hypothetical protein